MLCAFPARYDGGAGNDTLDGGYGNDRFELADGTQYTGAQLLNTLPALLTTVGSCDADILHGDDVPIGVGA
ncbi:MAG: hypothetical protein COA42_13390 [Alteromonadaceae bacterium]|nr:MAG: hypothetical protein COA42_13390 [Alteromonadaceae bacterium]